MKKLLGILLVVAVCGVGGKLVYSNYLFPSEYTNASRCIKRYYNDDIDVDSYLKIFANETGIKEVGDKTNDELAEHYFKTLKNVHNQVHTSYLTKVYGQPYTKKIQELETQLKAVSKDEKSNSETKESEENTQGSEKSVEATEE